MTLAELKSQLVATLPDEKQAAGAVKFDALTAAHLAQFAGASVESASLQSEGVASIVLSWSNGMMKHTICGVKLTELESE